MITNLSISKARNCTATMVSKEMVQKMISEAVEKGLITPFEEKVINRTVDILGGKIKRLLNSNILTGLTEDDLDLAEDVIRGFFNNTIYVVALRGNCIDIEPYPTNCIATEEGIVITGLAFRVILTKRRAGSEIDLTDMIERTKGINHHIINPKYKVF